MNMTKDIIQFLYLRFCIIYGDKFNSRHTSDMMQMWYEEWFEGLIDINPNTLRGALAHCRSELDWTPSIAEFRKICRRSEGILTPDECMYFAIRRDFTHDLVKNIYDAIGSWDMSHDSSETLLRKFKHHHSEIIAKKTRLAQLELRQPIKEISHGSENNGRNPRNDLMQKVEGYLF